MNPITSNITTGTLGELLVQIRLLQYGVQAAPPLKDSGNDLIAVYRETFQAIQVKTTTNGVYQLPDESRLYHILAVVELVRDDRGISLDESNIYLIKKDELQDAPRNISDLRGYKFENKINEIFEGCFDELYQ